MIDSSNVLLPLKQVEDELKKQGFVVQLIDNNFNVVGDKKLVTNVVISSGVARIYYGEFVFDLEGKSD